MGVSRGHAQMVADSQDRLFRVVREYERFPEIEHDFVLFIAHSSEVGGLFLNFAQAITEPACVFAHEGGHVVDQGQRGRIENDVAGRVNIDGNPRTPSFVAPNFNRYIVDEQEISHTCTLPEFLSDSFLGMLSARNRRTLEMAELEFGLLSLGDLLPDPNTGLCRTEAERHRTLVEQAVLAEQVGMHAVHLGEHHGSSYQLSAPAVVLAAIGERTSTLKLSTGVTLVANLDPFRIAEDYATLDVLFEGRAEIVAGRGSLFARTFEIFGQDPKQSRALFTDHVELLLDLLRNEDVHAEGLRPLQGETSRPRPFGALPVWVGGGTSNESIDLAARLGCPLMLPSVFAPPEAFAPMVERYRENFVPAQQGAEPFVGACCHCHVAADSQQASDQFRVWYQNYWEWVQSLIKSYTPHAESFEFDYDRLSHGPAMVGSPAQIVDRIGRSKDLLGLDRMIFMFDLGGIPDKTLYPNIELFGAEVVPQVA